MGDIHQIAINACTFLIQYQINSFLIMPLNSKDTPHTKFMHSNNKICLFHASSQIFRCTWCTWQHHHHFNCGGTILMHQKANIYQVFKSIYTSLNFNLNQMREIWCSLFYTLFNPWDIQFKKFSSYIKFSIPVDI
jgi:hypothetical protein